MLYRMISISQLKLFFFDFKRFEYLNKTSQFWPKSNTTSLRQEFYNFSCSSSSPLSIIVIVDIFFDISFSVSSIEISLILLKFSSHYLFYSVSYYLWYSSWHFKMWFHLYYAKVIDFYSNYFLFNSVSLFIKLFICSMPFKIYYFAFFLFKITY